ncbi:uncharacterized protein [Lolium perenne]|uniref:uncharacterized protein n=1 Tax=Lolium perenne TaxID=4522 RepID=UPI003A9920C6
MSKVVEMEISLMYDILYTKAAVIHTWYGYMFHLVSPLPTALVFTLFQLSGNKDGYDRTDVAITYILLVGAFLLDMVSVFNTLGSTWTCNFLLTRDRSRLGLSIMSLRRHFKAFTSNRRWSGSIGQYNLFHFCTSDRTKRSKLAKMMGLKDWWNKCHYSGTIMISEAVKELVFKRVWILVKEMQHQRSENQIQSTPNQKGVEEPMAVIPSNGFRPEFYNDVVKRRKKFDNALNLGAELQEAILTWHILTNVFLLCSSEFADPAVSSSNAICISRRRRGGPPCFKQKAVWSSHVKAIKALSDYMVFLVAVRPNMVPGELRSLYVVTTGALRHQWLMLRHSSASSTAEDKGKRLAHSMLYRPTGIEERSIILSHGTLYAKLLLELVSERNRDKPGVISSYEECDHVAVDKLKRLMPDLESSCRYGVFDLTRAWALILDTWVRLLVFASVRCSRETHARQISRGGDLMTVVWLMEEHANVFFNQSSTIGDDEEAGRAAA